MPASKCLVSWMGSMAYSQALELQMRLCALKKKGFDKDILLLLEHPPTITLGRSGAREHLLVSESVLKERGIEIHDIDRGGDITYHGPGQLVGYPILFLEGRERDVRGYMRIMEESLIQLLALFNIQSARESPYTGVWTGEGKIAAMGVHISRWITSHGFALNVNTDLSHYELIVPCGIRGKGVTSMRSLLSREIDMGNVAHRYIPIFGDLFQRDMIQMSAESMIDKFRSLFAAAYIQ